jgi:hypothetical protein
MDFIKENWLRKEEYKALLSVLVWLVEWHSAY